MIIDCLKLPSLLLAVTSLRVLEIKQINFNHPGECSQPCEGTKNKNEMFPFFEGLAEWLELVASG